MKLTIILIITITITITIIIILVIVIVRFGGVCCSGWVSARAPLRRGWADSQRLSLTAASEDGACVRSLCYLHAHDLYELHCCCY